MAHDGKYFILFHGFLFVPYFILKKGTVCLYLTQGLQHCSQYLELGGGAAVTLDMGSSFRCSAELAVATFASTAQSSGGWFVHRQISTAAARFLDRIRSCRFFWDAKWHRERFSPSNSVSLLNQCTDSSNRAPPKCKSEALPTEPTCSIPHFIRKTVTNKGEIYLIKCGINCKAQSFEIYYKLIYVCVQPRWCRRYTEWVRAG
jgi:hypothetical protein